MQPNQRRCTVCRSIAPKSAFWRIVRVYPSHTVQLDQGMGRSAYLCPTAACLQAAYKKNRLGRSLKATVPESIYQALWQRLAEADRMEIVNSTPYNNIAASNSDLQHCDPSNPL
ncbi:MAG: YlxR family protein [Leptolyngbyaceae cyanobacterium SL_7_1]|nr:YlxR family protein [Leptolyngbyaceae cyanobacterium SL_7_1]